MLNSAMSIIKAEFVNERLKAPTEKEMIGNIVNCSKGDAIVAINPKNAF